MAGSQAIIDGNEAVARMAYALNEVIAIYPITPASPMGEWADQWASAGQPNAWGLVPEVVEMQSEAGASGAMHGSLQSGALTTTFTASQGLLLMMPVMYKIAGELTPAVIHVAARSVAAHALSIFCDHSDVMAMRPTGFAQLTSASVQEAADFAVIAQVASLESRIPFLHFFDGFRTSHEVRRVDLPDSKILQAMVNPESIRAHRQRALTPDRPVIRGTAQNPDVFFQAREAVNPFYHACPTVVQAVMDRFAEHTGRHYRLFDYVGAPDAERVIVAMGSALETIEETVDALCQRGEKVGLLKVRLYLPFCVASFLNALPATTRMLAVLDRTKEPGAVGEPLYLQLLAALHERPSPIPIPRIIGGRYGLSSKEFTPAMVKAVFEECRQDTPRNHFTVGIHDDVTHSSLPYDPQFSAEHPQTTRAIFWGLGSDGTVGANKNSIKIIGDHTDLHIQGYFVYDSKKSGSVTVSHLRFGPHPIRSEYLIDKASFVACHQFPFLEQLDVLDPAVEGATFLLNSPYGPDEVWDHLPKSIQQQILDKRLKFFVIDAFGLARELGLGRRINTIMQMCFFALAELLPQDKAADAVKKAIEATYGKRGPAVVARNHAAVDMALNHLHEVALTGRGVNGPARSVRIPLDAPEFVRTVTAPLIARKGDDLPVSALPPDGTFPTGTTKWEKRNIADMIPEWDPNICIQCGKCVLVCPHGVIRGKTYEVSVLEDAPEGFLSTKARWPGMEGRGYTLQVAAEDCTGCSVCVEVCPVKNKSEVRLKAINMKPAATLLEKERRNWDFFLSIPDPARDTLRLNNVKDVQLAEPLFEFSGACAGCGETPYVKLMSQMFGDRALVANATGCSSIYGGNLPTTPWSTDRHGRGPAWSNSLFENNAEFGLGMRLAVDKQADRARTLLPRFTDSLGETLILDLLGADQSSEAGLAAQRGRVAEVKRQLAHRTEPEALELLGTIDMLVRKNVWVIGGDGWAYDIGFGGLDHLLASSFDVNVLLLDTEVYSNTGGQMSKATPRGAVAKFAAGGKPTPKKDLAMIAMTYGSAYVAQVAMGADDRQTLQAFQEAEAYPGPSLIIAYSQCIAHGYDLAHGMDQQRAAVRSGHWPLLRYHPDRVQEGLNPLELDSKKPDLSLRDYIRNETRYTMLAQSDPRAAAELLKLASEDVKSRRRFYEHLAAMPVADGRHQESAR